MTRQLIYFICDCDSAFHKDFYHVIYLSPATKLGQGYIFTSICDSVHRGENLDRYPLGRYTPGTRYLPGPGTPAWDQVHHPPGPGTPPRTRYTPQTRYPRDQVHPSEQCMLGDTGNKRVVRILLECILVYYNYPVTIRDGQICETHDRI